MGNEKCKTCKKAFLPNEVIYGSGREIVCFSCMKLDCQKQLRELCETYQHTDSLLQSPYNKKK